MRAMVLAAGLGTRLRPLTFELPKPMVPVLDRPVMAHIVDLLHRNDVEEIIANLHYFPDSIRDYFGDSITYRFEEELLGTAGGVRNCADFFGDETFLIISGDALTDIDIKKFYERHKQAGGVATLAVKRVDDTREYGVVIQDGEGRIGGFQEKPDPSEALSNLGNCGIYMFEPEIFDYFPDQEFVDWANDVFPALLAGDIPFYVHEIDEYWNDVGSLTELKQGTFDAITGAFKVDLSGTEVESGVTVGSGSDVSGLELCEAPAWIGQNVEFAENVKLQGPVVIGDGCNVGTGAAIKDSIVLPGTDIASDAVVIGAIVGHAGIVQSLRPPNAQVSS